MSVALSAAVAEVGAALRARHVVASLRALDVDLQSDGGKKELPAFKGCLGSGECRLQRSFIKDKETSSQSWKKPRRSVLKVPNG